MRGIKSITTRYILIGLVIIGLIASFISLSFWFTNRIKDDARRINLAGKGRMLNYEMAWLLNPDPNGTITGQDEKKTEHLNYLENEMAIFEEILHALRDGSGKYELGPLSQGDYLTTLHREKALDELDSIIGKWHSKIRPTLTKAVAGSSEAFREYNTIIHGYVDEIDSFVSHLEKNYKKELIFYGRLWFAVAALSALIFISLIFFTRKSLVKPILRLRDAAKAIERGNLDISIKTETVDEIGELGNVFNSMARARKTAEDDLKKHSKKLSEQFEVITRSKREWQNTFDSITDLISIHDRDFNIIKANRAFAEYFGLTPPEIINKKCYDFFHFADSSNERCPHMVTLNENRSMTEEIQDIRLNRVLRISTFPYYSPEGESIIGSVHIARDITGEKEKEMRLIMSERLAALGQLASGLAHEINNPLASIAGCAEGLHNRVKKERYDPELFDNYLRIIQEEVSRCKGITTSMLSFVRKTTYEKKEININDMLDKTLEMIGFQGRLYEVEVIKNYTEEKLVIYGSEGELRQISIAIITNALDAIQDKGILTLETGIIPPTPLYPPLVRGELKGGALLRGDTEGSKGGEGGLIFIKISDTGPGIPREHIDRIFDPFFTTKSEIGGTGLGLSIARKLIKDYNGDIHVVSEEGKGTAFKIILPV